MNRIYTFKKISEDFFVMQIENNFLEKDDPKSVHTFFMNKLELDTMIQKAVKSQNDVPLSEQEQLSMNIPKPSPVESN